MDIRCKICLSLACFPSQVRIMFWATISYKTHGWVSKNAVDVVRSVVLFLYYLLLCALLMAVQWRIQKSGWGGRGKSVFFLGVGVIYKWQKKSIFSFSSSPPLFLSFLFYFLKHLGEGDNGPSTQPLPECAPEWHGSSYGLVSCCCNPFSISTQAFASTVSVAPHSTGNKDTGISIWLLY